ncbi:large conductance mechanosensitive channel protein MscL [Staphylococcus aureus]|nr:large conductance mechanosensitive channel protein MscL [Staphylococcus aureus]WJC02654.1 large conductance mechanosensitive channel protein MscL [Staphylococcus aureus]
MLKEFKEFALKGNVLDLAIAVVMGAAFNKIISSLVENIIMPLIGKIFGSVDFAKEWSFWGVNSGLKMLFYGGLKMSFFSGLRLSYI